MTRVQQSNEPQRKRRWGGWVWKGLLGLLIAYLGIGTVVALKLTVPKRRLNAQKTPAEAGVAFEAVRFPARGGDAEIAGWYAPVHGTGEQRAVVLVHGKDGSRTTMMRGGGPALMSALAKVGISSLAIDLRGHGESSDARMTFGLKEYRDILGAVDFLRHKGAKPGHIGVFGESMGGGSALYAMAREPGIGVAVTDCALIDFAPILEQKWTEVSGLPNFMLPSVRLSTWILAGEDPMLAKPLQEADRLVGRPLLIMHAREDATIPLSQAEALHAAVKGSELWIVEQAGHVDGYKVLGPAFLQRIVQFFDAHLPREQGKTGQQKPHPAGPTLRLPEGVRPSSYSLQLEVQPSAEEIRGELTIELEVTEEQPILWLNAAPEVQIDKAELSSLGFVPDSAGPLVAAQQERPNRDFVGLQFPRPVAVGKKKLTLQFHSKLLQHEGVGIFHERDADNDYVFTDFEPLDARRSLPVFDEPQFKVPLQLTLDVPEGLLAVANAPQEREAALRPGFKRVIFRPTPPLPTYLWALAVGPFGVVDAGRAGQNKIPLRILTLKGREAEGRFAASVTKPIVEQLERYLGSPFPYEKLDQIAVPNQSHAMENAGLVTYGLRTLQMNATTQTAASERRFTAVCAHELAHQWTGDLVTMKYWDDLWLNESFASFLDSKIVENLRPEWGEALDRIRTNAVAMDADSLLSARRIRQPITSNDDIVNAFDPITYAKGKAVLYMLEDWLSPTVFQKGLQGYLKKHAHANATGADFLAALSSAAADAGKVTEAGLVKEVAASFLDQPGVPLVKLALQCDGTGATLRWEQKRYLGLGTQPTEGDLLKYRIPLCYEPQGQARTCVLLDGPRGDLPLGTACPRSLLSNVDGKGYYRVQYQGELLQAALDRLFPLVETKRSGPAVFPPATTAQRVSFLRGLDALVRGGLLPADKLATILPNASSDANRHVAGAAVASAQALRELLEPSLLPAYQALIERVFGRRMQTMGLRSKPADSQDQRLLRAAWMQLLLGEGSLVAERQVQAETMLKTWLQKPGAMDAETGFALADAAPQRASGATGTELWQALFSATATEPDRVRRSVLYGALGSFRHAQLADQSLQLLLDPSRDVRETLPILYRLARFPETRSLVLRFAEQHFDALAARLPRDGGANLGQLASAVCDAQQLADAERILTPRTTRYTGGARILRQAVERARQCVAFSTAQRTAFATYLQMSQTGLQP